MTAKDVGNRLKEMRETKGWSIEELIRITKIKEQYLFAIEEGELDLLPSPIQVKGFLRGYADAVSLDHEVMFELLEQDDAFPSEESFLAIPEETPPTTLDPETIETPQTQATPQAQALFEKIGQAMHDRRDTMGLSLDDVAQFTHIPPHHLKAIEQGEFHEFPTPLQARGMLGNYAEFLEMNPDALFLQFAEGLQTQLAERQQDGQATPQRESRIKTGASKVLNARWVPNWIRRIFSPDILTVTITGTLILVFIAWGLGTVLITQEELAPQATSGVQAEVLFPTETPIPTITPDVLASPTTVDISDEEIAPTEEFVIPDINTNQVSIFIITNQRTYLKISVDEKVVFDGRVNGGANLPYTGNQSVEVVTGNAAAVQVFYNDRDMGTLGIFGEVINVIYTLDGVITPTQPASLSATNTPTGP